MVKIDLKYNHYLKEIEFQDGRENKNSFLKGHDGEELSEWCAGFINNIISTYNDSITLTFTGIEQDCDTFEDEINRYNNGKHKLKIKLILNTTKTQADIKTKSKIEKLRELYSEIQSDSCPFDELRTDKDIEMAFNKALNAEFEIAVVATMSSGKSTLINSMLGEELLPAKLGATTATIARIHDEDTADHFRGESFDIEGNQTANYDPLSIENMSILNDNKTTAVIEVYGNIVGISSQSIKLVLTDTPGPNTSRTEEHKTHTYRLIKDSKYKPMVLYIFNARQLETNDDNTLLTEIADAMRQGGRQASDRFIFVVNQADAIDNQIAGETLEGYLTNLKNYLEKHGIKNPKFFPCSAYYAKLIRKSQSNRFLTKREQIDLNNISIFFDDKDYIGLHLSDMADISDNVRVKLKNEEDRARANKDRYADALIQTGIPAIEGAISEYLEKYAQPQKITEALYSFMQTIKDLDTEAREMSLYKDNQKKVEETIKAIKKIKDVISNGEKGQNLKNTINSLSFKDEMTKAYEEFSGKKISDYIKNARNKYCNDKLTIDETRSTLRQIQKELNELRYNFAVSIENLIKEKISNAAERYILEYNKYVEEILNGAFKHKVKVASLLGKLANMKLDTKEEDLITYDLEEDTGKKSGSYEYKMVEHTEMVKKVRPRPKDGLLNKILRSIDFLDLGWGTKEETYEEPETWKALEPVWTETPILETHKYVNFTETFDLIVPPKIDVLSNSARIIVTNIALKKEQELKHAFNNSFEELNVAIEEKLKEKEKIIGQKEELEKLVEQSKNNLSWIKAFSQKLKVALE